MSRNEVWGLVRGISFLAISLLEDPVMSDLLMMACWYEVLVMSIYLLGHEASLDIVLLLVHWVHLLLKGKKWTMSGHNLTHIVMREVNAPCHWGSINS